MKKIALAGNPNCGKTTMFNALTGSNQYVGNWPGVTVEKKEGKLKGHKDVMLVDLPGIYSLSPYSLDEVVARNYLINERPDAIINIVDASNLERNLYLTTQLLELGIPVVVALNMMDLVKSNHDHIDTAALIKAFACPMIEISALKNEGLDQVVAQAVKSCELDTQQAPAFYDASIQSAVEKVEVLLTGRVKEELVTWFAIKHLEADEEILGKKLLDQANLKQLNEIRSSCEAKLDDDMESIITNARYNWITSTIQHSFKKGTQGLTLSDKIDRIVTNRWLALPIFVVIMGFMYYISVTTIGTVVTDFTNDVIFGEWIQPGVTSLLEMIGTAEWLISLVVDGIIGGIGAPIGFAPQMGIMFLFLSFLEDCGYMARVAFIMDRIFRRFGLSGKSFIPLMISSGCGVPAIMATKTIEDEKDRRMTIMTSTFIPCGAKLPVIALLAGALMGGAWWMAPAMYFMGIGAVIISAIILKKTSMFAGDPSPFVMELPKYHMPAAKSLLMHVWERLWSFLKKAGTVLFVCCAVMWFLVTFGFENGSFTMVEEGNSLLAGIGNLLSPIFAPLGFGNWQAVASSLSGFVAKEQIVSTISVISGAGDLAETDPSLWVATMGMFTTGMGAVSFLIFNLLDSPCLAAISTVAKEMNSKKWTTFAIVFQTLFAYTIALMVYQLGSWMVYGTFGAGTVVGLIILAIYLFLLFRPMPKGKLILKEAVA